MEMRKERTVRKPSLVKKKSTRKPLVKKRSTRVSISEVQSKKEPLSETKRSNVKAVAPPPSINKRNTKSSFKNELSVDVSKFVKEAKGDLQDRYIVKSVIGKGGYGEVRLVKDKITGNQRAMKVIPKESYGKISNSMITTEIQMLKRLDHPNIIKIYEFYQDNDNYYLITEYCSGGELYDYIINMKNFSEQKTAQLMKQILSAITYCHTRNIVHRLLSYYILRDIKPENLLFESKKEEANLKVIDFGTSMIFKEAKLKQKLGTVLVLIKLLALLHCT